MLLCQNKLTLVKLAFKTKVVITALRDDRPVSELASQFGIHPTVIGRWKRESLASRRYSTRIKGHNLPPLILALR